MKIICIINNFLSDNIIESEPVFLLKPDTSILYNSKAFFIPQFSETIGCSVSPIIKINKVGKNISAKFAHRYYDEISVGIDFTDIKMLQKCIENHLPWDAAKSFECSSPFGAFFQKNTFDNIDDINIKLCVNDSFQQRFSIGKMRFSADQIIEHVSQYFTIKTGDIIYLGTPEIAFPSKINDRIQAYINDLMVLDFFIR